MDAIEEMIKIPLRRSGKLSQNVKYFQKDSGILYLRDIIFKYASSVLTIIYYLP
jgi:hypothetical protein